MKKPKAPGLLRIIWTKNHYFLWVWLVLMIIVVVGYETQFDRERICKYQYCPSTLVVAAGASCIVLAIVWVNIFFGLLRPYLRLKLSGVLGTRVMDSDGSQSLMELLLAGDTHELWETESDAPLHKKALIAITDLLCLLLFLMLPMAVIIGGASGIAYLEQKNSPPPPGLAQLERTP